uniref:Uncharacterized protein n=1 Tax=Rhizophora mucronata TaxID=61149 RepID=A0A2P2LER6_RHIMU
MQISICSNFLNILCGPASKVDIILVIAHNTNL